MKAKKIISAMLSLCMLGAMAVMPAQAAGGVRVDPQTFYADTDGIEVKVTDGTLEASDIIITKKADSSTVAVTDVVTDGDVATIPVALEIGEKYIINIGDVERHFEITAVVDGIDDLTPVVSGWGYNPKGAKIVDNKYFLRAAHLAVKNELAGDVSALKRYTVSYDYGRYDGGWAWGQRILWNATANGTANSPYPKDGYGFHMSYNALANNGNSTIQNSLLKKVSPATTADTTVKSTDLYVRETGRGTATDSGIGSEYAVNVTEQPTKYWPIKIKKNGAEGTLFIDGHEIYTYDPGSDAPTTGYFVLIQDNTGFGSISNFLITTSTFTQVKNIYVTDLYADEDEIKLSVNDTLEFGSVSTGAITVTAEGTNIPVTAKYVKETAYEDNSVMHTSNYVIIKPVDGKFPRDVRMNMSINGEIQGTTSINDYSVDFKILTLQDTMSDANFVSSAASKAQVIDDILYMTGTINPKAVHNTLTDYSVRWKLKPYINGSDSTKYSSKDMYSQLSVNDSTMSAAEKERWNLQKYGGSVYTIDDITTNENYQQVWSSKGTISGIPSKSYDSSANQDEIQATDNIGIVTYDGTAQNKFAVASEGGHDFVDFKVKKHGKIGTLIAGNQPGDDDKMKDSFYMEGKGETGYFTISVTQSNTILAISDFVMTKCVIYKEMERIGAGNVRPDEAVEINIYGEAATLKDGLKVYEEDGTDVTDKVSIAQSPDKTKATLTMADEWKGGATYTVEIASQDIGVADPDWQGVQSDVVSFDFGVDKSGTYVHNTIVNSGIIGSTLPVGLKLITENAMEGTQHRTAVAGIYDADGGMTGVKTIDAYISEGTDELSANITPSLATGVEAKGYLVDEGATDGVMPTMDKAGITDLDNAVITIEGNIGTGENNRVVEAYITKKANESAIDDHLVWFNQATVHSDGKFSFSFKFNGGDGEYYINVRNNDKLYKAPMNYVNVSTIKSFIDGMCNGTINVTPLDGSDAITDYAGALSYYASMLGVKAESVALFTTARDEALLKKRIIEAKTKILEEKNATPISFATIASVVDKASKEVSQLKAIEATEQWTDIRNVATSDESVLGLVFTNYDKLTDIGKQTVWGGLVGKTYADADAFKSTFDSLVTQNAGTGVVVKPSVDSGTGTGNRKGGAGAPAVVPSGNANITDEPTQPTYIAGYSDIASVDWAHESIKALSERGIVSGVSNGVFEPNRPIKREELIKMIVEAFGLTGKSENVYSDVDKDAWYADYVAIAVENGIINGVDDNNLGIGMDMSRQDLCTILYRAAGAAGIELDTKKDSFSDTDSITDYAADAVAYLCGSGIIDGVGDNLFDPNSFATRAQTAKILWGLLKLGGGNA